MAKKQHKARILLINRRHVKMAAANDVPEVVVVNECAAAPALVTADQIVETPGAQEPVQDNGNVAPPSVSTLSPVGRGAAYHKLAGAPSKATVIAVFGKSGYALSWVARAAKLGITAEELVAKFRENPEALRVIYAAATTKQPKA